MNEEIHVKLPNIYGLFLQTSTNALLRTTLFHPSSRRPKGQMSPRTCSLPHKMTGANGFSVYFPGSPKKIKLRTGMNMLSV